MIIFIIINVIFFVYHSFIAGTKGSKPNSSTGITNSTNLLSYALTIFEWAFLIYANYYYNSAIIVYFLTSTSWNDYVMASNFVLKFIFTYILRINIWNLYNLVQL